MSLSPHSRLENDRRHPRMIDLWFAMQPLRTTVRFMNTGAHPDDETSAMLAALGFRDGLNLSYACANRGEGGQNDIGTQMSDGLGALRTREMERAADVLNMRLYWLSEAADDSIFDFGFSKSGVETLGKWGRSRTLKRFVDIIRAEQPDIICPTFLDIPGQHGHHRAMTEAAHLVMTIAADETYTESSLKPWQISKLYLPAWSGAGQAYDDDLPPPPTTLVIDAKGRDPVSGWSYERIGQHSRAYHKTQGMGRWIPSGAERDWPLHLAISTVQHDDHNIFSGLPKDFNDWAEHYGGDLARVLANLQSSLDATLDAFPSVDDILNHASQAVSHLRAALDICTENGLASRLQHKEIQLAKVIQLAAGSEVFGLSSEGWVNSGSTFELVQECHVGAAETVETQWDLPPGWGETRNNVTLTADAQPHNGYRSFYDPLSPSAPALVASIHTHGVTVQTRHALVNPPVLLPPVRCDVTPDRAVLNSNLPNLNILITLDNISPIDSQVSLELPMGWVSETVENGLRITAPSGVRPGLYHLPVMLDGAPAQTVERIAFDHIDPTAVIRPASVQVRVVDVKVTQSKVGYIGGGNDRVAHWLAAIGVDVDVLGDAALGSKTELARYDTIIIGIFAFKHRLGLTDALPILHDWARAGGHLVTLYHRPWDNWNPSETPPARLEIGQPSLRWRVTDETAAVTHLAPEHPLLTTPNVINDADWNGWHKERGLYLAKSWDEAYVPLLSMSDPDEAPQKGSLLSAKIGAGRHTHCALILHHQMEKLTSGGFRLMANLVSNP